MVEPAILAYISVCVDVPQLLRTQIQDQERTGEKDLGGTS
jgi:hypothetical protein